MMRSRRGRVCCSSAISPRPQAWFCRPRDCARWRARKGFSRRWTARRALPAHWQLQCACALGTARRGATGKSDWDGADRTAPPADGGYYFERDGTARRGILDVARSGAALRDFVSQRGADSDHGDRKLDVEDQKDPHPRRGAFEDSAFDAVLFVAEGCGAVPGGLRRIPPNKE